MKIQARQISFITYVFFFSICSKLCTSAPNHLNIIFILVDDLGWNDVSFHGSKQIPTPNIDALARDGVILNNYYVQPLCTPSRGALMTGKYPIHIGLQHDVIYAAAPWGLPLNETTLPQYMKELGYTTRGLGKWHLGFFKHEYLPVNRGFDSFFGFWTGKEDFFTHFEDTDSMGGYDLHDDNKHAWDYFGYYATDLFTAKATDIIKAHNTSKPLFLYLAHQAVHTGNSYSPFQSPKEYSKKFSYISNPDRREFAGIISALDVSIGEIFTALENSNMLNNSLIVFSSDNGAAVEGIENGCGSNWPLRGSKYTLWEGGIRAVGFVWGESLRRYSRVHHDMMHLTDWLPTLYSAAGGNVQRFKNIDGFNLWPSINNEFSSPRQEILHNIDPNWQMESIRKNNYKLIKSNFSNGDFDGWYDKNGKKMNSSLTCTSIENQLYNQKYDEFMRDSQVANILNKKYGKDIFWYRRINTCETSPQDQLEINCGRIPQNATTNCDPKLAACLFDIRNDPCEFENLAANEPEVVKELEGLLNKYRKTVVPPVNQPHDEASNPKYYGYTWIPWKS